MRFLLNLAAMRDARDRIAVGTERLVQRPGALKISASPRRQWHWRGRDTK